MSKTFRMSTMLTRASVGRPLPEGHMRYARCDAHYLLHLAARLTAELERVSTTPGGESGSNSSSRGEAGTQTLSPLARALVASQERTLELYRKPTSQVLLLL
jgi:ribonuclease D